MPTTFCHLKKNIYIKGCALLFSIQTQIKNITNQKVTSYSVFEYLFIYFLTEYSFTVTQTIIKRTTFLHSEVIAPLLEETFWLL